MEDREVVEVLEEAPAALTRPLGLVEGRAYAATWLPVRVTERRWVDEPAGALAGRTIEGRAGSWGRRAGVGWRS